MAEDKKLDPGTGGINIDGRLYTLDIGVPDDQGGDQGEWSSGDVHVDNTEKDISTPTKKTLAQYLSNTTKAKVGAAKVSNKYTIDSEQTDVSLSTTKGNPSLPTKSSNSALFDNNLEDSRSKKALDLKINRGKADTNNVDGNDLLKNVQSQTSPTKPYVASVLNENRWYSPTSPLSGIPVLKTSFDKGSSLGGETVSFNKLSKIGPSLSTRASLELGSTRQNYNPNSVTAEASALLPGAAQAAIERVNVSLLSTKNVLEDLTNNDDPPNLIDPISLSWGTMNNVNDQYSGLSAIGMVALSTALVAALQVAIEALFLVFSIGQTPKKHATRDTLGRYSLGSYYYGNKQKDKTSLLGAVTAVTSLDLGTLLGIQPTNFPFQQALKKGSRAFFGIDDTNNVTALLTSGIARMAENPGFNAVIARTIIRSSLTIVDQTKKIKGNPVDVSKQVIGLIEVLKSSKIIAACNVFAQLGDAILSVPENFVDGKSSGGQKISNIDALPDSATTAVSKSRIKNSLKLAWAQDRTNTLLLLPKNITAINAASKNIGISNPSLTFGGQNNLTKTKVVDNGRISNEDIVAQEKLLDAEYVPFYFHDLRTNEIVSFHAFLTTLTDDYTANYEKSAGYGRVEDVSIYKSTNRHISLGFYVISTSPDDFDNMWLKLNKLVTLLYPQYTAGKLITDGDAYNVRQPFSQLIGASPMIRLRLGDLLKSNYSRFNIAKLFGLGDQNMMLNNKKLKPVNVTQEDLDDYNKKRLQVALNSPSGLTFIPAENFYPSYDSSLGNINVPAGISVGLSGLNVTNKDPSPQFKQQGNLFMIKVVKKLDDDNVVGEVMVNDDLNPSETKHAKQLGKEQNSVADNFIGGKYVFPLSCLQNTNQTNIKMYSKLIGVNADDFGSELSSFLSDDINNGNAIVKSFKTMEGKGIAGYIESMNFNWYDRVPWEISDERKAPKMCQITLTFNPIHDISPGLSSDGSNRAAIYPVGLNSPTKETK